MSCSHVSTQRRSVCAALSRPTSSPLSPLPAGVPALILTVGCLFVPESANFMVEKNEVERARKILTKIRGTHGE